MSRDRKVAQRWLADSARDAGVAYSGWYGAMAAGAMRRTGPALSERMCERSCADVGGGEQ
jgi:hypothetical protein